MTNEELLSDPLIRQIIERLQTDGQFRDKMTALTWRLAFPWEEENSKSKPDSRPTFIRKGLNQNIHAGPLGKPELERADRFLEDLHSILLDKVKL